MKLYTKTGDRGTTSLVGGTRVAKNCTRLESYGTVDELNSHIGLVIASGRDGGLQDADIATLTKIQNQLFDLGCRLATEPDSKWQPRTVTAEDIAWLESEIDRLTALLPARFCFVLPGGTVTAAHTQVARTVARRAERIIISLYDELDAAGTPMGPEPLQYVNRLSDYLYALARVINIRSGTPEPEWH